MLLKIPNCIATTSQVPFGLTGRFWSSGSLTWFFQASENTGEILGCAARALLSRSVEPSWAQAGRTDWKHCWPESRPKAIRFMSLRSLHGAVCPRLRLLRTRGRAWPSSSSSLSALPSRPLQAITGFSRILSCGSKTPRPSSSSATSQPRMSARSAALTACAASHDLKEPLQGIYKYAPQLVSESRRSRFGRPKKARRTHEADAPNGQPARFAASFLPGRAGG